MKEENNIQDWNNFVKKVKIVFNDKSKTANAKWKIENFKQEKRHIIDFMIEFEVLAIKVEANDIHIIFLLKKDIRSDIVKMILRYLPIKAPESLKKWKVVIISVEQGYKSIELKFTCRGRGTPMDIRRFKDNYKRDGKPRYFNYNINGHIAKDFPKPKKEKETKKYYKCDKVGHLIKNCRLEQKMKNRSIKKNQTMKTVIKRRVFLEVWSKYGITNLHI